MHLEKARFANENKWPSGIMLLKRLVGHDDVINEISWSPDGRTLASCSDDGTIRLWNTESGKTIKVFTDEDLQMHGVCSLAWSIDSRTLASGSSYGDIYLWDVPSGRKNQVISTHHGRVCSLILSAEGRLFSASDDNIIQVRNIKERGSTKALKGHADVVWSVKLSPNEKILASGSDDGTIRLWEIENHKLIRVLRGHDGCVYSVVWSPDGQILASSSNDRTVRIWHVESGEQVSILEGHTHEVMCVRFSNDGSLLASQSADGTVRIWRSDNWETVAVLEAPSAGVIGGLAFHPHDLTFATRGEKDTIIRIWSFDVPSLFSVSPAIESVRHTTAKIVLVGDAGVGKTGLGWRLAQGYFKEHPSTHGEQFWVLNTIRPRRTDGTECEAVLWDLAGQPDYRLIHSLFLDDAELALVLFDPSDRQDPLHGVDFWFKTLAHKRGHPCRKILVGARLDRGAPTLTEEEIKVFCDANDVTGGYVATSAKTGEGLEKLIDRIRSEIVWESMTSTVTTATFRRIKQFVLGLKENGHKEILLSPIQLRKMLQKLELTWQFTDNEIMTAIKHLAKHGYVRILTTVAGEERILLKPELLNNLAASFILEARRNPKGLGALDEARVLRGEYDFRELVGLNPQECDILLDATTVLFIEHNICFRETLGPKTFLIFPELINLKKPQLQDDFKMSKDISYTVTGAVGNIYAALVVLLGYTNTFARTNQWQNQAQYGMSDDSICGFELISQQEAQMDFVLYYRDNVSAPNRLLFQGLFEKFLTSRDVSVIRYPPIECPKCRYRQERAEIIRREREGKGFLFCSECGKKIPFHKVGEMIGLSREHRRMIEEQQVAANRRTQFEAILVWVKGFIRDRDKTSKAPRCFISYAWGNPVHEAWVEKRLATDLRNAGVDLILDRWYNTKIGSNIARFISLVTDCNAIIVVGTPDYLIKYKNLDLRKGSIVAAEVDLINQRLLGTEEQKKTVLPIILEGDEATSLPPLMRGRVYGNFAEEGNYFTALFNLVLAIYRIPPDLPPVIELRTKYSILGDTAIKVSEPRKAMHELISTICLQENFGVEELTRGGRNKRVSSIRSKIVQQLIKNLRIPKPEIAKTLSVSLSTISRIAKKQHSN